MICSELDFFFLLVSSQKKSLSEKDLPSRWHCGTYLGVIRHSLLRKHLGWLPSPPWIRAAGTAEGDRAQAGFSRLVLVAPTTRCHLHSNFTQSDCENHLFNQPLRKCACGWGRALLAVLSVLSPTDVLI